MNGVRRSRVAGQENCTVIVARRGRHGSRTPINLPRRHKAISKADAADRRRHRTMPVAFDDSRREKHMAEPTQQRSMLEEIDVRQDDVLKQLDQLNLRIETMLKELMANREVEETPAAA